MIVEVRAGKALLSPQRFIDQVDRIYQGARENVIADGHAAEVLVLLDGRGMEYFTANETPEPFSRQPDLVRGLITRYRAKAAIHVVEAYMSWLTGNLAIDAIRPKERPDREEALTVTGEWPAMQVDHIRCAGIVRPAGPDGPVDLLDLEISGAAGLRRGGVVTAVSWLSALLSRY